MFTDRSVNSRASRRPRQPWPKDESFKILSLDGGGIRGIFGACLLNRIQQKLAGELHISKYFDLIAGTSTGGIMAIGLGLQIGTNDIERLYREEGEKIFPPFWTHNRAIRFIKNIFTNIHDHRALESALHKSFQTSLFGHSDSRLVIPAFMGPKAEIAVFKTDHHPDFKRDWETPAWKIARATSAAPTVFSGLESEYKFFLDGGIWANNPIMCAIVDAMSSYDIQLSQIKVLSLGTGNPAPVTSMGRLGGGLVTWRKVITTAMYLTTDNAHGQAGLLIGPENIIRLAPSEDNGRIALDDWRTAELMLPNNAYNVFDDNIDRVREFFDKPVAKRECYYSS